jgi:hypothetical protein
MKKLLILATMMLAMFFLLLGCSNDQSKNDSGTATDVPTANTSEEQGGNQTSKGLEGIVDTFKEAGMTVGDYQTIAFDMIGAKDGRKFELNGSLIEIYEFDPNNLTEDGKKIYDSATNNGTFEMSGFQVPCVMNGNYMLVRADEHPDKDKIIEIFKSYK